MPRAIEQCELTHLERTPIDYARACAQHDEYEALLRELGCEVIALPEEPDLPDSVFVEDTAVVLPEVAVITRPGAGTRRDETPTIAKALHPFRDLLFVRAPATLDGGDVLVLGNRVFVGQTPRSSAAGITALGELLAPLGYSVEGVPVDGCLHLKSAATAIGEGAVLANPEWVDPAALGAGLVIESDPSEPFGANAVLVGDTLIHPAEFPRTQERLAAAGFTVRPVAAGELAKAEGGVTCCSLVFTVS